MKKGDAILLDDGKPGRGYKYGKRFCGYGGTNDGAVLKEGFNLPTRSAHVGDDAEGH